MVRLMNPVMITFPINKRINTELFIDRTAALYILETQINKGDQPVEQAGWRGELLWYTKPSELQ